jgi:la-related protein 1
LTEQIQSNKDTFQVSDMNQKQDTDSHQSKDISHVVTSKVDTARINFFCRPQETERKVVDFNETRNMDDSADDFGTFLLDEEIELEQKMPKKTELSSTRRYFVVLIFDF